MRMASAALPGEDRRAVDRRLRQRCRRGGGATDPRLPQPPVGRPEHPPPGRRTPRHRLRLERMPASPGGARQRWATRPPRKPQARPSGRPARRPAAPCRQRAAAPAKKRQFLARSELVLALKVEVALVDAGHQRQGDAVDDLQVEPPALDRIAPTGAGPVVVVDQLPARRGLIDLQPEQPVGFGCTDTRTRTFCTGCTSPASQSRWAGPRPAAGRR